MDANARKWRDHVEAWRKSGETMAGYCRRAGVKTSAFGYWKGRLEQLRQAPAEKVESSGLRLARVRGRAEQSVPPTVSMAGSSSSSLRLILGRATVEVPPGFDATTLGQVLDVLETRGLR